MVLTAFQFIQDEGANLGDVIIMSDVDEIPRKEVVQIFR